MPGPSPGMFLLMFLLLLRLFVRLVRETRGAALFTAARFFFTFAARLWALIMAAATRLSQNARLLYFAVELFQRNFE